MKRYAVLLFFVAAFAANSEDRIASQNANAKPQGQRPQPTQGAVVEKTNEIPVHRVTSNGAAVQMIKARNPLQLINPFAPSSYGSGEQNVVRDPITGRVTGIKLFSVQN